LYNSFMKIYKDKCLGLCLNYIDFELQILNELYRSLKLRQSGLH